MVLAKNVWSSYKQRGVCERMFVPVSLVQFVFTCVCCVTGCERPGDSVGTGEHHLSGHHHLRGEPLSGTTQLAKGTTVLSTVRQVLFTSYSNTLRTALSTCN